MDSLQSDAEYFLSSVRLDTSFTLLAFSILYYDYALTIVSEIQYFWSPPSFSIPFLLFVINRYLGLLGSIPVFFEFFGQFPEHRCRQLQLYHQAYAITSQVIVAILLLLRTYALYNCNKRMLVALSCTIVVGVVQCIAAIMTSKSPLTTDTPLGFEYTGCNLSLTNDQGLHLALAWSSMLWFDIAIFILTLIKAVKMRHEQHGGLLVTIFRDGTIYFAILVAVNICNITTFVVTRSNSPLKGTATTLANVFSVTLTSRLMLNLRDPSIQHVRLDIQDTGRWPPVSTGQFTSRLMSFMVPTSHDDTIALADLDGSAGTGSTMGH